MELIRDIKKLNQNIGQFEKMDKKRDDKIHLLACSALNHANENGDHRPLTKLYHAFGNASNPNEFRYWVGVFCPALKWDKEAKAFVHKKDKTSQGACDMEGAIATPFWKLEKVRNNREFDALKDAKGVVNVLKRHINEAQKAGENELAEAYAKMAEQAEGVADRVQMLKAQSEASVEKRKAEDVS